MSIGVLIVSHDGIGEALLKTAVQTLGFRPLEVSLLSIEHGDVTEELIEQGQKQVADLDQGDGVLVLTDIFGSTPANIACRLAVPDKIETIAGVNLPMLIRILNYPQASLVEHIEKALEGGREGVMHWQPNKDE